MTIIAKVSNRIVEVPSTSTSALPASLNKENAVELRRAFQGGLAPVAQRKPTGQGTPARPLRRQSGDAHRIIEHVLDAISNAAEHHTPFFHLQFANVFPADLYPTLLSAMPVREDYRQMSGRTKSTRTNDGSGTRTKIDLFPEYIRHLPLEKRKVWAVIGKALCSVEVREAFRRRLASGLQGRFGQHYGRVGLYPVPILTRDVPGYQIGIHPDTHWKGITVQIYLPRDRSSEHVGTVFHKQTGEKTYEKTLQMLFSPNSGYAFAVDKNTFHSVDTVGPEVPTRDSILLTYFVDWSPLQIARNRMKRVGNFLLNEMRALGK